MRIGWIEVLKRAFGETTYSSMAQDILSRYYDLELFNVGFHHFRKYLYPLVLCRLWRITGEKDIWIRNFDSIVMMPHDRIKGKNVALIFHIDFSIHPAYLRPPLAALEKTFYHNLKKAEAIITISKYWRNHFLERGYPKVYRIYNAFDLNQFQFEEEEISQFKRKFRLGGKPIIYLGNCQRIKGVVEAYEQLKGLDVHLVTSGRKEVNIPALNFNLNFRDYLLLLKSSSTVITMSKFEEGWNRTAHEAMLCKTPVIGSGLGGMRELLEEGGQIICEEFSDLREKVSFALTHPEIGEKGYGFAREFTIERFKDEWLKVIEDVA